METCSDEELIALLKQSRATPGRGWREPMLKFIGSAVGKGWPDLQIKLACAPYSDGGVDDPDIQKLVSYNLTQAGFRISTAATGLAALNAVQDEPPDLIILDIMLPDLDGLEVGCAEQLERPGRAPPLGKRGALEHDRARVAARHP